MKTLGVGRTCGSQSQPWTMLIGARLVGDQSNKTEAEKLGLLLLARVIKKKQRNWSDKEEAGKL